MRDRRTQADLVDEILAEMLASYRVPALSQVWTNELNDIDADIRRLQVGYSSTFLLPASAGTITTVYRQAGEFVSPSDSVVRVENQDGAILIVGQVRYRAALSIGAVATLSINDVFGAAPPVPLKYRGPIVAVRGHDARSDTWDVIIQSDNQEVGGSPIRLPINYAVDPGSAIDVA